MIRRLALSVGFIGLVVFGWASPAIAHTGTDTDLTSNYRVRIRDLPAIEGLSVRLVDINGQVHVTWRGIGTLVVYGYEAEPYLRISGHGVERNVRSPAMYVNQDRYAATSPPAIADATAPPQWELVSTGNSATWHDHRTHWMSPLPPPAVRADPDAVTVVFERWEIPLDVNGTAAVIAGDLIWVPPPSTNALLTTAGLLAAATWVGLVLRPRVVQPVATFTAVALFTLDTYLYFGALPETLANRLFSFVAPAVALGAAAGTMRASMKLDQPRPTLATLVAGLVLGFFGGIDRAEVLTNSQIWSDGPAWLHRLSVIACIGIGIALVTWFAMYLLRVKPVHPAAAGIDE